MRASVRKLGNSSGVIIPKSVLAEAGGKPEHLTRMTWYVVDKREYIDSGRALGAAYREIFGRHYPAMSAVEVRALMEDGAKVEIECTAVIPTAVIPRDSSNAHAG